MKKRLMLAVVAVAAAGLMSALATTAYAFPTKTSACSGCHSGAKITVTATQTSNDGTNASYSVSAPGADYIAVFSGSKVAQITGASGSVSLPVGKTYTFYAVQGPTTSDGLGSASVSPVAPAPVPVPVPTPTPTPTPVPVPDPTPVPVPTPTPTPTPVPVPDPTPVPVPVPDPTPVPVPVPDPTPVPVPTPDPTPVPAPAPSTMAKVTIKVMDAKGHALSHATVTLVNQETGKKYSKKANSKGTVVFGNIPAGSYTVTASYKSVRLNSTLIVNDTTEKMSMRVRSHSASDSKKSNKD